MVKSFNTLKMVINSLHLITVRLLLFTEGGRDVLSSSWCPIFLPDLDPHLSILPSLIWGLACLHLPRWPLPPSLIISSVMVLTLTCPFLPWSGVIFPVKTLTCLTSSSCEPSLVDPLPCLITIFNLSFLHLDTALLPTLETALNLL